MSKEKCKRDDCDAEAYHLSTVNSRPIQVPSQDGRQIYAETWNYKCTNLHISKQDVWVTKNIMGAAQPTPTEKKG